MILLTFYYFEKLKKKVLKRMVYMYKVRHNIINKIRLSTEICQVISCKVYRRCGIKITIYSQKSYTNDYNLIMYYNHQIVSYNRKI